jgi:uncharacterized protein YbjT (DUF2867 family)
MERFSTKVLVIGATGKFAGLVVPALRRRGAAVRALVRDEGRAAVAVAAGATETMVGDLRNPQSLAKAADGMDGVFYIGPAFAPDEAAMGLAIVDAAIKAKVRKFVFSSVIQPTNVRLKNHASKVPVEQAIYSSNLQYTILHPANFMQNIGLAWPSILRAGSFSEPFPSGVRIARVDYRDVAEVASIALTRDDLAYATLDLCAGMYSRVEVARVISEELGRPVEARETLFSEWALALQLPYSDPQLALLARVHDHYGRFGLGGNSLALAAALGRQPTSLTDYVRKLAASQNAAACDKETANA